MTMPPAAPVSSFKPRVEDDLLVRGAGRFVDDLPRPGQLYACFVRSPHAHARVRAVDVAAARDSDGVVTVLTAADMTAAGITTLSRHPPMVGRGRAKLVVPHRPALASERVMHVGEAVAVVIAASPRQAQDAVERVDVTYEDLTPVTTATAAIAPDAPQLWPEAPGNLALDWPGPVPDDGRNAHEVAGAFKSAAHVARVVCFNQRIAPATMEPRGATASYDLATDTYTLRACSQGAGTLRDLMAPVMGLKREQLHVITEDVGGAFGMKTPPYPEYPALLVAAKMTGKPVHWMSTRSEAFLSDNQARDIMIEGKLALDDRGKFLALKIDSLVNLGAYLGSVGAHLSTNNFARCFPGMYRIPLVEIGVRCVFTNTLPTAPFRGAGRPEANYVLERLVEAAARITGIAPDKIRRRNLIPPSHIPYKTAVGTVYDSGDFPAVFDKALALADYAGFAKRRRESAKRGMLRGVGISCLLEHSGGLPTEAAAIRFPGDGTLTVDLGVQSTGQGHATVYARLAAERLGIPADRVRVRQGDSRLDIAGGSSVASRSTMTAGSALVRTVEVLVEKGRAIAGHILEAAETDIAYGDGVFTVVGTDRRLTIFELAERAAILAERGEIAESLDTKRAVDTPQAFPNGCHIAEVEIDPETGTVAVVSYTAVDDCGNVLDHTLVEGQVHGGVAQGLGQALLETIVYDPDNGQLVTGSFVDYAMPHATDVPTIVAAEQSVPATTNPLGVKGVGEAGTTGALGAIMNAIADAIPGGAGARLDMPATPEKVWTACHQPQLDICGNAAS